MVADKHTSIPVAEFKAQLSDTSDVIGTLDLAPSTKKMMNCLSTRGFGKLFSSPGNTFS
jgi:cohesin complex subunit SCC1